MPWDAEGRVCRATLEDRDRLHGRCSTSQWLRLQSLAADPDTMLRIVRRKDQMQTNCIAPTNEAFAAVGFHCTTGHVERSASQPEFWEWRNEAYVGSHIYQQAMCH